MEKWEIMGPFLLRSRSEWWSSAWLNIAVHIKKIPISATLSLLFTVLWCKSNEPNHLCYEETASKINLSFNYTLHFIKTTFDQQECPESSFTIHLNYSFRLQTIVKSITLYLKYYPFWSADSIMILSLKDVSKKEIFKLF